MRSFEILLVLSLMMHLITSEICTCDVGSYFASPDVSEHIYQCGTSPTKIESWALCAEIGTKCTNPVILEPKCFYALVKENGEETSDGRESTFENGEARRNRALVLAPAKMSGGLGDDAIIHSLTNELKRKNVSVVLALKDIDRSGDPAFQNFALRLYEENVDEFRDISREFYSKPKYNLFENYAKHFDRVFFTPTDRVDGYYGCMNNAMNWLNNVARVADVTNVTVVAYSFDLEKAKKYVICGSDAS